MTLPAVLGTARYMYPSGKRQVRRAEMTSGARRRALEMCRGAGAVRGRDSDDVLVAIPTRAAARREWRARARRLRHSLRACGKREERSGRERVARQLATP